MLSGGDVHISATFSCTSDAHCAVRGSFFFEPQFRPQAFSVGDCVQLIGVEMQEWHGSAQLSGRNVQINEVLAGNLKGHYLAFILVFVIAITGHALVEAAEGRR